MVGVVGVIALLHLSQKVAQLDLIQGQCMQEACLLGQMVEQHGKGMPRRQVRKGKNVKLPAFLGHLHMSTMPCLNTAWSRGSVPPVSKSQGR